MNYELEVVERLDDTYKVQVSATALTSGFSSIEVGRGICGTRLNGVVVCWDWLGFDSSPIGSMQSVSVGDAACGVRVDHTVECWGSNEEGQTVVPGGLFIDIGVGDQRTCGLRPDRTVEC